MKIQTFNYEVFDQTGRRIMIAPESCRYDKETERKMIQAGYSIKLKGKKITKKELS